VLLIGLLQDRAALQADLAAAAGVQVIESRARNVETTLDDAGAILVSTLTLVDLAGSCRAGIAACSCASWQPAQGVWFWPQAGGACFLVQAALTCPRDSWRSDPQAASAWPRRALKAFA
jgi:hypothetical protein